MAEKPQTSFIYYVVSKKDWSAVYTEKYQFRYLRRSSTPPTIENAEEIITVAVTKYPADGSQLNTDPLNLLKWNPDENTFGACQTYAFYDAAVAEPYIDDKGNDTGAITGGFVLTELTYYFYCNDPNSENYKKYMGTGTYDQKETFEATLKAPRNDNGVIVKDDKYTIKWDGNGWNVVSKGGTDTPMRDLTQTYKASPTLGTVPTPTEHANISTGIDAKLGYYEITAFYSVGTSTWIGSMNVYIDSALEYTLYLRGGENQTQVSDELMIYISWLSYSAQTPGTIKVAAGCADLVNKNIIIYIRYWPASYKLDDAKTYVKTHMLKDYDMDEYSEGADTVISQMGKLLMHAARFTLGLHEII